MSHLTCHGLAAAIGGRTIVSGVDLDVPRGSMLAVVGRNGSGKSRSCGPSPACAAPSPGPCRSTVSTWPA